MSRAGREREAWAAMASAPDGGGVMRPLDVVEVGARRSRSRSRGVARSSSRDRGRSASRSRDGGCDAPPPSVRSGGGAFRPFDIEAGARPRSRSRSVSRRGADPSVRGIFQRGPSSSPRPTAATAASTRGLDPPEEVPSDERRGTSHEESCGQGCSADEGERGSADEDGSLHSRQRQSQQSRPPSIARSFSTGRTTYHVAARPHRGFSTPFCGMFRTTGGLLAADDDANAPQNGDEEGAFRDREIGLSNFRTDLCSLPCFGVLQSDYTRFLLTHTRPPTASKRLCLHFITPIGLFCLAGWFAGHIRNDYANSVVCTTLVYCVVVWIVAACYRGRKKRVMVREEVLFRLRRREERIERRLLEERARREGNGGMLGLAPSGGGLVPVETEEYEYYR